MPVPESTERAVSQVVGFVLLFSLIVLTASAVYLVGFQGIEASGEREALANAERSLDGLAADVAAVRDGTPRRSTRIRLAGGRVHTGEPVHWNVTAQETGTGTTVNRSFTVETTPVVYTLGSTTIVYSGGMVLREEPMGNATIHRPPDGVYGPSRAVVPLVNLTAPGDSAIGGRDSATVRLRLRNRTVFNTSDADRLRVNVTSPRASAWQRHFNRTPGTTCSPQLGGAANCTVSSLDRVTVSRSDIEVAIS